MPAELNYPVKGLISNKNDDNKCFLWCHVSHLNCADKNLKRITKKDKEIAGELNYIILVLIFQFLKKIMVELK